MAMAYQSASGRQRCAKRNGNESQKNEMKAIEIWRNEAKRSV